MDRGYNFWLACTVIFLAAFNAAAWITLVVTGTHYIKLLGLGILAYTLGLRHAFDADHIAAIDNTTRKLVQEGKKPVGIGFFFSLGHSTVVAVLAFLLITAGALISSSIPYLQNFGSLIGTGISALFLYLIGALNLFILADIYKIYKKTEEKKYDETELNRLLGKRGLMNRIFGMRFRFIERSWQMYPVGFLFGLGFDTASEVALLAVTAIAAGSMPLTYVMILPLMFTAGMTLLDTADGLLMLHAYNWAFRSLLSKIYYNMAITVSSVLVAFFIGGIEWLQVISMELGLKGPAWSSIQHLDFGTLGLGIVIIFVGTWGIAALLYRMKYGKEATAQDSS